MALYQKLARGIPDLKTKLMQAGMAQEPEEYVRSVFTTSMMMAIGLCIILFIFTQSFFSVVIIPLAFPILFTYLIKYVDLKIEKIKKKIDEEIIFAGRFLIIGLESGVPTYKIFEDMEKNYKYAGFYFGEVLNKVYLGTAMEVAINESLVTCPSPNLRRILFQVVNSMQTGTPIGPALNSVLDQIVREQTIKVKEYGKKLNPLAMFYLTVSIILPSLGITMLILLVTFMGINISMPFFVLLAIMIGFMQFMFLSIIKSSRPSISNQ